MDLGVSRQHLAHIGLGYAKLSRNHRRFDACFECRTNGIDLPARQRDCRRFRLPLVGRFVPSRRTLGGLIAWSQSASPLCLFKRRRNEQVQFLIVEMLDCIGQVFGQEDMPLLLRGRDLITPRKIPGRRTAEPDIGILLLCLDIRGIHDSVEKRFQVIALCSPCCRHFALWPYSWISEKSCP
jgi:hypothetical protein